MEKWYVFIGFLAMEKWRIFRGFLAMEKWYVFIGFLAMEKWRIFSGFFLLSNFVMETQWLRLRYGCGFFEKEYLNRFTEFSARFRRGIWL